MPHMLIVLYVFLDSPSCSKDKLEIRDNRGSRGKMCGPNKPLLMTFYSDKVTLTFVSDGSGTGEGFLLRYNLTAVTGEYCLFCGLNLFLTLSKLLKCN